MRIFPHFGMLVTIVVATTSQAADHRAVKTTAGKAVQLGYYSVFHKDCTAGEPPTVNLTRAPANGVVVVKQATLTTERVQGCPKISAPTRVISYTPSVAFSGTDEVGFDVVDPASGKVEGHTVTVTVEGAAQ